jgi:hypothetical protein
VVLAARRFGDVWRRRFPDSVLNRLALSCPTVVAANDGVPSEPVANRMKASEPKLIRFNLHIIWSSPCLRKPLCSGFVPDKFVSTCNAGIRDENPHGSIQIPFT